MESIDQPSAAATAVATPEPAALGPQVYELSQRTLFSAAELRRLTSDYDTIRRACSVRLAVLFRTEFELKLDSLETPTFRQFVGALRQPTQLALFKVESLRGLGVLEIAPALALSLLDRLLGGPGANDLAARELTEIEMALLDQINQLITDAWCAHWKGSKELKATLVGHENDPRYLQTSAPETTLVVATFTATVGECSGQMRLALPLSTLEPLLQKMRAELKPAADVPTTPAPSAPHQWNPALDHVNIPISTTLTGPQISARQLQALKVGDVLHLPLEAANQIQVRLNGVPRYQGRLGTRNEHWAVEVLNALKS